MDWEQFRDAFYDTAELMGWHVQAERAKRIFEEIEGRATIWDVRNALSTLRMDDKFSTSKFLGIISASVESREAMQATQREADMFAAVRKRMHARADRFTCEKERDGVYWCDECGREYCDIVAYASFRAVEAIMGGEADPCTMLYDHANKFRSSVAMDEANKHAAWHERHLVKKAEVQKRYREERARMRKKEANDGRD